MPLREMTDFAFTRACKRIAQLTLVGIALAGLTACGGGGSSTPKTSTPAETPTPTPPEIPITPTPTDLPPPTEAELEAAAVITAEEAVTASLESADDVKYYRLDVAERRTIEFTLDADEGIEIAILDSTGSVITTAVTASEATTRVQAPQGSLYVRVRDKLKKGWRALDENRGTKAIRFVVKQLGVLENIYNIIRRIPRVNLTIGGVGFIIDLRDYVRVSDGRTVTWSVEAVSKGIGATLEGSKVTLQASGEAVSGGFIWKLTGYDPIAGVISYEVFEGTVARRLPTLSDVPCTRVVETTCIHDETIALGGTYTSRSIADYFDYPVGTRIRFVQAATMTPRVEGRTHRIVDGKLVVTVPSDPDADRTPPDNLLIYLSAVDPDGASARRLFSFTIEEEEKEEEPTHPPPGEPFEPYVCALPDAGSESCEEAVRPAGGWARTLEKAWVANGEIRMDFASLKTIVENSTLGDNSIGNLCRNIIEPWMAYLAGIASTCGNNQCEARSSRSESFQERVCDLDAGPDTPRNGWRIPGLLGE